MVNKINYSPLALKDLEEIWDYIALKLCNQQAAEDTVNGIMDVVDELIMFPERGAKLYFDDGLMTGYRYVMYKNYMSFYRIGKNEVFVDRVLYAKTDYMNILF